jgi:hypothetical protein
MNDKRKNEQEVVKPKAFIVHLKRKKIGHYRENKIHTKGCIHLQNRNYLVLKGIYNIATGHPTQDLFFIRRIIRD